MPELSKAECESGSDGMYVGVAP